MGQLDALLFKNFALLVRQRKSLALQVVAVVALLLVAGISNLSRPRGYVYRETTGSTQYNGYPSSSAIWGCNPPPTYPEECGDAYWGLFVNPEKGAKLGSDPAGTLTRESYLTGDNSGVLGDIPQYTAMMGDDDEGIRYVLAPFFEEAQSASSVDNYFIQQTELKAESDSHDETYDYLVPNLAYLFEGIDYAEGSLAYVLQSSSVEQWEPAYYYYYGDDGRGLGSYEQYYLSTIFQGFATEAWGENVMVTAQAASMIGDYWVAQPNYTALLTFILVTPALMLLLPLFVLPIVIERGNKILSLNKLMGMRMRNYWLSYFICNYAIYGIQLVFIVAMLTIFFFGAIWQSGFVTIPLFLLWGFTQVALGMFIAALFSGERTATLVSYLVTFLCILTGYPLNLWTFSKPGEWASWWYYMVPPWVYMRGFALIQSGLVNSSPLTLFHGLWGELLFVYFVLIVEGIVMALLAVYLEQVMPTSWGHRRPVLFPLHTLMHMIKKPAPYHYVPKEDTGLLVDSAIAGEGKDIAKERQNALKADPAKHVMSCIDIRKEFNGKPAIDNVSLTVEYNETLGLLGSNGAGKTTLLSVLSGMLIPTAGNAMVGGFDPIREADLVQEAIGICPQFDILWDDLTVDEHLRFYFRMKGNRKQTLITEGGPIELDDDDNMVPDTNATEDPLQKRKPLHVRVSDLADLVGLSEHVNKRAKALSGGNRRKLSIAIALVGDPKLVMLDEPSSGLDPEARRDIWDIINEAREGRSFIITTHNMEECDTLATKIAIMTHGKLACVGTQQSLKSRFGKGFSLSVTCRPEFSEQLVHANILRHMPELQLERSHPGQLHYLVEREGFDIGRVFSVMREYKADLGIQDYGLAQASLEEVFLKIVDLEDERLARQAEDAGDA